MDEEERLELERLRAAGQRASDDYESMLNAPSNKVNIPSFGQPASGIIPALPAMPTVDQAAPAMSQPFGFAPTEPLTPTERDNLLGSQELDNAINSGNLREVGLVEIVPSQPLTEGEQADLIEGQMLGGKTFPRNLSEALDAPMPVTNVGLMGEPLREQPSINQIRFDSRPDRLASKELENKQIGFFKGIGNIFTGSTRDKLEAEKYAPRNQPLDIVPSGNTMRPEGPSATPEDISQLGGLFNMADAPSTPQEAGQRLLQASEFYPSAFMPATEPMGQGLIDNNPFLPPEGQSAPIELPPLTRNDTPEATFLRADGSIGEIFPGQRIGDAFPGNPDTPLVGGPLVPGQKTIQGVDLPGGVGFVRAPEGMVKTIGPDGRVIFSTPEQANAAAPTTGGGSTVPVAPVAPVETTTNQGAGKARRNAGRGGINEFPVSDVLDTLKNLDSPGTARGKTSTGVSPDVVSSPTRPSMSGVTNVMTMEFRDTNQDGIEDRSQGIFNPGDFRGSGANLPTLSSVNAMAGMAPQGRPPLSAFEQASLDRQRRIGGTGSFAGDSAAREARIAARPDFNEAISDRDRRAARGGGLSQADARDLAQGMARDATVGERARALQIQSRLGMGAFRPGTPRVDKLSQATSTVDRMIQNGQLSPEKRNAAIQRIMGLGDVGGASGSAGSGIIGSAEFDRISAQLQPGGSLYEQGIRVDPSKTDPNTGAALIYRVDDGGFFGFSSNEPVSPELVQQLLPFARAIRRPGVGDFAGMGMTVNQFAGSR